MTGPSQKETGGYHTPEPVASTLVRWAVRSEADRLLDPARGDGRFLCERRNSFGVEREVEGALSTLCAWRHHAGVR